MTVGKIEFKIRYIFYILTFVFLSGCANTYTQANIFNGSSHSLNEKEMRDKLINGRLFRNSEEFYILSNGHLLYADRKTTQKSSGSWYLRTIAKKHEQRKSVICFAMGYTKADQFTYATCYQLIPKDDKLGNLYLGIGYMCNVANIGKNGNISCDFQDKQTAWFRISKNKLK